MIVSRDGWLLIKLYDWSAYTVGFRNEGKLLHYRCDCRPFAAQAPMPCAHVPMAGLLAYQLTLMDKDGRITPSIDHLPVRSTKTKSKGRATAALAADGSIRLLERDGKPVTDAKPVPIPWQPYFSLLKIGGLEPELAKTWPAGRELIYVIDPSGTNPARAITLETMSREPKKDGTWKKLTALATTAGLVASLPDDRDRDLIGRLVGCTPLRQYSGYDESASRRQLTSAQAMMLLPLMCQTGRCWLLPPGQSQPNPQPLRWDDEPWRFVIDVNRDQSARVYRIGGHLERDGERCSLRDPTAMAPGGFVFFQDRVSPLNDSGAFQWVALLRARGEIRVPLKEAQRLLEEIHQSPRLPNFNLPDELAVEEITLPMQSRLKLTAPKTRPYGGEASVNAHLEFEYGGKIVDGDKPFARGILDSAERKLTLRNREAEAAAHARLQSLGFRQTYIRYDQPPALTLLSRRLPEVLRTLIREGWHVEAEGKLYRKPGEFKIEVSSGIDWFDLTATVDFDGQSAPLPSLLAALRKGENVVRLGDGTFGILPETWLKKYGGLAEVGTVEEDRVRFTRTQVGLLDALLASQPEATFDDTFRRVRDELHNFSGVVPVEPPATFTGELRPYQKEGLGWFQFLRRFGFGGCLADDMGLGKTVQVLALLESRRTQEPDKRLPALVVVPRSLVFNWKQEATRFAPGLRLLDHSQPDRRRKSEGIADHDIILTTYGTLLRDVAYLKDVHFDYVILDEAQAVKNPTSESAKSVRLLQSTHRLALTGTPVQNHLGDLWSLFDFLNPGMLGAVSSFSSAGSLMRAPDEETRRMLSRGLRPFILRRTKDQVARDLPEKLEQTLYCELEPKQRKLYDELKEHYRQSLLSKIDTQGMAKSKIQILEALLRLRQAACHPGLIDKTRGDDSSAKLDMLMPRLSEAHEEGHKVLVFSQFTSFLSLLKKRLDDEKIVYEYLDGKTKDRQARVDRFQSDPDCKLFLISLKAGGVGLNLTAADYVFLLDPWWNPAIEAQAIDRTHRIGQTRQVFACRLIARETVEEKVLALQQSKRDLADAIINADNSLIRTLGREDLELLLS